MILMKRLSLAIGLVAALAATCASAQSINLTGTYVCVDVCRGGLPAHITQNGPELNLLTEAGVPARAWPDWFSPASRIWINAFNEGAVYSPAGLVIRLTMGPSGNEACHHLRRRGEGKNDAGSSNDASNEIVHCGVRLTMAAPPRDRFTVRQAVVFN
jgi:hypothetical protein